MGIIHYIPVIFVSDIPKTTYCTVLLFKYERSFHFEDIYIYIYIYANYTQKLKQNHFAKHENATSTVHNLTFTTCYTYDFVHTVLIPPVNTKLYLS